MGVRQNGMRTKEGEYVFYLNDIKGEKKGTVMEWGRNGRV